MRGGAGIVVRSFDFKPKAARDLKKLSPELRAEFKVVLELLMKDSSNHRLRLHKLNGYANPNVFVIDLVRDCSFQISFEMSGDKAILRRIASHRQIDGAP